MRRQPLHESRGDSVMTRRSRRSAQQSRCYHLLPPPPPPSSLPPPSPPPPSFSEDHQLFPSPRVGNLFITTRTLPGPRHLDSGSFRTTCRDRLATGTGHNYHALKTYTTFGRPFELSNALTQVGKLPVWNLLLLFLVLSSLTPLAMCKPWIDEQPSQVTFRSRICQPVSPSDLRRRMGPAFDDTRMAADMASAKRLVGDNGPYKGMEGYQSDGPAPRSGLQDSSNLVEEERFLSSGEMYLREEGMMYRGNSRVEERDEVDFDFDDGKIEEREDIDVEVEDGDIDIEKKTMFTRRSWLPRRRMLNSHNKGMSSVYKDFESGDKDDLGRKKHNIVSDSYKYMRRRRRRRDVDSGGASSNFRSRFEDTDRKANKAHLRKANRKENLGNSRESTKKYKSLLPLRLTLSGKLRNSRKLRKQLKKEFRQQSRKLNKPPPWECHYKQKVVYMKKNVFPPVLFDGKCGTDKCFYRLYNCEPNKYAVKMLQRDEHHCNPLPMVGNSTIYEERWNIVTRYVTVGCNCASLVGSGKSKNKRKI